MGGGGSGREERGNEKILQDSMQTKYMGHSGLKIV